MSFRIQFELHASDNYYLDQIDVYVNYLLIIELFWEKNIQKKMDIQIEHVLSVSSEDAKFSASKLLIGCPR